MKIVPHLTWAQLKQNKKRTRITLIAIILSVAMVIALLQLTVVSRNAYRDLIIETDGNYHLSFSNLSEPQIDALSQDDRISTYYFSTDIEGKPSLYIRLKNIQRDYEQVANSLSITYHLPLQDPNLPTSAAPLGEKIILHFNKELLAAEGIIADDSLANAIFLFGGIFILIVASASVLVINNAFQISTAERMRQFGLLKSIGATNHQVRSSVFMEAMMLSLISIPIGISLGLLLELTVITLINVLLSQIIQLHFVITPYALLLGSVLAFMIVLIAAYLPAKKVWKISPIEAIRQTTTIKVSKKQLKTSRLTERLWKIEGVLAAKMFKRNRSKNRAAILSLAIGIVLFISVSSFGSSLSQISKMIYPTYGSDLMMVLPDVSKEHLDETNHLLKEVPHTELIQMREYQSTVASTGFSFSQPLTKKIKTDNTEAPTELPVNLFTFSDERYQTLISESISLTGITDRIIKSILINKASSRKYEFEPFLISTATNLTLSASSQADQALSITNVTKKIPPELSLIIQTNSPTSLNIIISETALNSLNIKEGITTYFFIKADAPNSFSSQAERLLSQRLGFTATDYSLINYSQIAETNDNLTTLVNLLTYGFISLLTVIAITSVLNTIVTSIELRKKEYAMLLSVGMTISSRNRLLILENIRYGLYSLILGLPIGLSLSYLFYLALQQYFSFRYEFPWQNILLSTLAVILLMISMTRYSMNKLKNLNIVETINSEII